MLTWCRKKIFCRFIFWKCWKDDPKDEIDTNGKKHRHKRHDDDDDNDDVDDDDSDEENDKAVKCNKWTRYLKCVCIPFGYVMFALVYCAPVIFITCAVLYHCKIGINHLHHLSVKE